MTASNETAFDRDIDINAAYARAFKNDPPFEEFRKIARLNRECVITEKIDGDNAQIYIADDGRTMSVGSRTRWITPTSDNHGFAAWCAQNYEELLQLGPGRHYGEWWGSGIQRGYGLVNGDKRFSLFNTHKWSDDAVRQSTGMRPACCSVVPVLYKGLFNTLSTADAVKKLREFGSIAAPGFMKPEGIVVYHTHAGQYFKATLDNDETPKSLVKVIALPRSEASQAVINRTDLS